MIRRADIRNFRCYKHLEIPECSRLNILVGENGSGKTALLEALFLPLSTNTEVSLRLRQQRGLDGSYAGSLRRIEDALWGDFFYEYDLHTPVVLTLFGDGSENRSLTISRGTEYTLPLSLPESEGGVAGNPMVFKWVDSEGKEHAVTPRVTASGIQMRDTGEDLSNFFLFPSGQTISSIETAGRFSELSKAGSHHRFVEVFSQEYRWIKDISIEISAGSPALFATVEGRKKKIPLANVSGGINRIVGILLAMASRSSSILLVDEIENGIFHTHQASVWRALLAFTRDYDSQLFVTTHSQEWLEALVEGAGEDVGDISLWRLERREDGPILRQFFGTTFRAGVEAGGALR